MTGTWTHGDVRMAFGRDPGAVATQSQRNDKDPVGWRSEI
jgi:hypothetical protein